MNAHLLKTALNGVCLLALTVFASPSYAADKVSIGIVNAVSDGGLFIAEAKGYFKEAGIEASFVEFDTGAKMVAPLGAGQLDVGGGAALTGERIMDFTGKVVLITGGASVIGAASARLFAASGAQVASWNTASARRSGVSAFRNTSSAVTSPK